MQFVTGLSRRRFGQGLGAALALAASARRAFTQDTATVHTITIREFAFEPSELIIAPGDIVVVVERRHRSAYSNRASRAGWDTGEIGSRARGEITFNSPGTHDYVCAFHRHMTGRVVVRQDG